MGIQDRLKLYETVESLRQRPLIVYVTSNRSGPQASGTMQADVIPEFLDQLTAITTEKSDLQPVDLLVVSMGGDPTVAWRAMSLLRERCSKVAVLVPQAAYSAATLLALGADEIIMHPHANFGPVDPQITVKKQMAGQEEPVQLRFGYEELSSFMEFARSTIGLTDQEHLRALLEQFSKEVGTVPIGVAARSSMLSMNMGKQLLRMHMTKDSDEQKIEAIAAALNKNYFHHGYPVSRREASEIGLKIAKPNVEIESAIWRIWLDVEEDLKLRVPFNPAGEVASHPQASAVLQPAPTINLPQNAPAPVLAQIVQQVLSQVQLQQVPAVDFENVNAIVESVRTASRFVSKGKILPSRSPDGQLKINVVPTAQQWQKVDLAASAH